MSTVLSILTGVIFWLTIVLRQATPV